MRKVRGNFGTGTKRTIKTMIVTKIVRIITAEPITDIEALPMGAKQGSVVEINSH